MRVAVLGSGMVGQAIASRLVELDHEVRMGSRTAGGPAADWALQAGETASAGDFADAAAFGELIVNATAGAVSLAALQQAGKANLAGKTLLDIANPIDSSRGDGPVTLTVANTDSLAEQIQRAFPSVQVVKALNTMNSAVMVHPEIVRGDHVVFLSGDHERAKQAVAGVLASFGWPAERIIDLGALATARGTEALLLLWLAVWRTVGAGQFNFAVNRGAAGLALGGSPRPA
jgi:8-hydroxy-5-deazaflavin:NADPH oxidoreductase